VVLADVEFHEAIVECANPVLASLLKSIRRSRTTSLPRRERWETVHGRYEAIYDAIAAGDAEQAAERMESHLLEFARELGVKASAPMAREKAR